MSRRNGARCLSIKAPQSRLAFNLSKRSFVVIGSRRRMSTGIAQVDGKHVQSSNSPFKPNRTWNSSHGIAFTSPLNTTWKPQHGLRFSSSRSSLTDSRMPPSENVTRQSLKDSTASLPTANNDPINGINFQLLQSPECPDLSLSGALRDHSTHEDPFYPLPDSSLLSQESGISGSDDRSQSSKGNDHPSARKGSGDEPFCSPLGFHIPKANLQSAMNATPPSPSAYWQHTLYRGPGGDKDTVKVHYCKAKEKMEIIAQLFLKEKVIGFDLEWKMNPRDDSIKKNVALVQVASERRVALFHLARFPNAQVEDDFITPSFRRLMESPDITKVGVNVKGDSTRLRNYLHIECRGLFELSHLYKLVKFSTGDVKKINKILVSLASQVQEHLQLPLWKGEVRSSDWSQELNYQQTQYAASDSYAGFQLYQVLESKRQAMDPTPPRPAHAELNLPIRLADGQIVATSDDLPETNQGFDEDYGQRSDASIEDLTRETHTIAIGETSSQPDSKASLVLTTLPVAPSVLSSAGEASREKSVSLPPSPELSIANAWLERYSQARAPKKSHAKAAELRAYALWHEQGFDVPTVAKLLRVPPLQNTTVVNYIGKAVLNEMLPYERVRIHELEQYVGAYGLPAAFRKKPKEPEVRTPIENDNEVNKQARVTGRYERATV